MSGSIMTCRIHPVALLSIVDSFERRSVVDKKNHQQPKPQPKVIGTLLGHYDKRTIEISNAYPVPHSEANENEPEIDVKYNDDLYALNSRALPAELPVGWFSTMPEIAGTYLQFHDYYTEFVKVRQGTREVPPVVLLTVDCTIDSKRMGIKAYLRTKAGIPGAENPHCAIFMPIQVEIECFQSEQIALDLISNGLQSKKREAVLLSGLEQMNVTCDELVKWVDIVSKYVDAVLKGETVGDPAIGRKLLEIVSSVTQMSQQQYDKTLNSSSRDFLMLSYLAELGKTQLNLYEKLLQI